MGVFGMAHAIWQAGATPEIGEIEQRLHGKQHIEDQQRTQQGTMAEQRIFSSGLRYREHPVGEGAAA